MGKRKKQIPPYYRKNIAQHIEKRYRKAMEARAELLEREHREKKEKPEEEPES